MHVTHTPSTVDAFSGRNHWRLKIEGPGPGTGDREIDSAPYLTMCLSYDFHASIELVLQLPSYAAN